MLYLEPVFGIAEPPSAEQHHALPAGRRAATGRWLPYPARGSLRTPAGPPKEAGVTRTSQAVRPVTEAGDGRHQGFWRARRAEAVGVGPRGPELLCAEPWRRPRELSGPLSGLPWGGGATEPHAPRPGERWRLSGGWRWAWGWRAPPRRARSASSGTAGPRAPQERVYVCVCVRACLCMSAIRAGTGARAGRPRAGRRPSAPARTAERSRSALLTLPGPGWGFAAAAVPRPSAFGNWETEVSVSTCCVEALAALEKKKPGGDYPNLKAEE